MTHTMLQRVWAVAQKEFIQIVRDRSTLMTIISMPVLQLLLYAYAINMTVDHIPTIVADQSFDAASQDFVDALSASGYFDIVAYAGNEAEVVRAIDEGRAQVGVVIPMDFAARVERGDAQALILVDGSDAFTTQSAYNAASNIALVHATDLLMSSATRGGSSSEDEVPLKVLPRILYNPDLNDLWFIIPGVVAMLLQTQTITITANTIVREREVGTIEQLLVTPIRSYELLLGKFVPNLVIALLNLATILALGVYGFGVPIKGDLWLFLALTTLYIFSGLGLGLLISVISNNQNQAQQMSTLLMLLALVLGGFVFPRYAMPTLLRYVGNLFPLTYYIPIAKAIMTKGVGIQVVQAQAIALVAYVLAVMFVAARSSRQHLD